MKITNLLIKGYFRLTNLVPVCISGFIWKVFGPYNHFRKLCWDNTLPLYFHYNIRRKSFPAQELEEVILVFDKKVNAGGLTDCLRGITNIFFWCRQCGLRFKLYFVHPFFLEDFLVPADYDWRIFKGELDYKNSTPVVLNSMGYIFNDDINRECQKKFLNNLLTCKTKQLHIYSNANCYDEYFPDLFRVLFKPSRQLQTELDEFDSLCGGKYISVSFRFCQLLGDIKDSFGEPLIGIEKQKLITRCLESIKYLIVKHTDVNRVLVTSDSNSFLAEASKVSGVFLLPGAVNHIRNNSSDEFVRKTFWDMFMISKAVKAYMVRTPIMYRSGFAAHAAMIGNIPFEEVVI